MTTEALNALEEFYAPLRKDQKITGIWIRLQRLQDQQLRRVIVYESNGGSMFFVIADENGKLVTTTGTTVVERIEDSGILARAVFFIPSDESGKIELERREF